MTAATIPAAEFTPVMCPRGCRVHALTLSAFDGRAACGLHAPKDGWRVSIESLTCGRCRARLAAA